MLAVSAAKLLQVVWLFVESDLITFAIPNTVFGILGAAMTKSGLVDGPPPLLSDVLLKRGLAVFLFNFYSLLLFDLGNQRSSLSVSEDRVNKPWRPIPSGRVTSQQARRAVLLVVSPAALCLNHVLGIWKEGLLVQVLSWYYNELHGSDEPLFREALIAFSYGVGNSTSLLLAIDRPRGNTISRRGHSWIAIISAVILTTMHVQDLKDQEGDRLRSRKTIPLLFGERFARRAIAVMVPFWSCVCASFWRLAWQDYCLPLALGLIVAWRVMVKQTPREDATTWRLWCLWHSSLYALPLLTWGD
ncbi:UbiA prenyltransferase family [Bombardia bombarda]|uniref:UbiA prenyltransferase family n=1 Tax=Bombardia bombarda TaxID=252184 RepID=A0AA40C8E1_9PEZI|nr:UbiA prenyltransferase family [Bombardia bombarda]